MNIFTRLVAKRVVRGEVNLPLGAQRLGRTETRKKERKEEERKKNGRREEMRIRRYARWFYSLVLVVRRINIQLDIIYIYTYIDHSKNDIYI